MSHNLQFYIDGSWVDPVAPNAFGVVNPSNEEVFAHISLGSKADVDKAVAAAGRAFQTFGFSSRADRLDLLQRILQGYNKRAKDFAEILSQEMGAPLPFALECRSALGERISKK